MIHISKPHWLKTKIPSGENYFAIKQNMKTRNLATVCEEAKCPNIGECWSQKTATFMIGGDTCTRACRFCHVKTGNPQGFLNHNEPQDVAQSVKTMGLTYVVITMVDRDDLADGAAGHVASVIQEVKKQNQGIIVEILAGDFGGQKDSLFKILKCPSRPEVFAHNLETVKRLSPKVRDGRASYQQSLRMLEYAKEADVYTKSSLMLGLGETLDEVRETMKDLRSAKVDLLTLGQYMRPTKKHLSVKEWITPEIFDSLKETALELGFLGVASGPLIRSSYKAFEVFRSSGLIKNEETFFPC